MKRVSRNFKKLYKKALSMFYGEKAAKIQKLYRTRLFIRARWKGSLDIQRVYKGYLARRLRRQLIFEIRAKAATKIALFIRGYLQRKHAYFVRARRQIAYRRIKLAIGKKVNLNRKKRAANLVKATELKVFEDEKMKIIMARKL